MIKTQNALTYAKSIAYSSPAVTDNAFLLAKKAIEERVEGDFVECGVAAGSKIIAMALASLEAGSDRKVYAYDSYEGIPLASNKDSCIPGIKYLTPEEQAALPDPTELDKLLVSSKVTVHGLDSVKHNIQQAGLSLRSFVFIKGWFEHTLPVEANLPQKIAVLRLDGDLYSSTEVTLRYLAPRLSPGAYVIVDDYALAGAKRAVDEYFGPKDWVSIDGTGPVYLKL